MPRKARMYLPGIPAHVVQRGHNRDACFFGDEDFSYYLQVLGEGLRRYGAALHAYCLMTNHVHLLLTPQSTDSISRLMQHVGRQYVQYINKKYGRSGTLWEGRHKGSLIDAENYLLRCYRYIELNPVTGCIVQQPVEYPWSSFHYNAMGQPNTLITPHPVFEALSADPMERRAIYRALFQSSLSQQERQDISESLAANHVLGGLHFKFQVEAFLERPIGHRCRGRPKRGTSLVK